MSGHLILQTVRVTVAAPKSAPTIESVFGERFRPSTIQYETLKTAVDKTEFVETVTLFSTAGDDYTNITFFKGYERIPEWVPEPPVEYMRLLAMLKEVADA